MHRLTRAVLACLLAVGLLWLAPGVSLARSQHEAHAKATTSLHHRVARSKRHTEKRVEARHKTHKTAERRAAHEERGRTAHRAKRAPAHAARRTASRRHGPSRHRAAGKDALEEEEARPSDTPRLSFAPDPMLHHNGTPPNLNGDGPGIASTGGGASDLLNGPPTSTNIDNLGQGRGPKIVVPLFKLLNELSGPPPASSQ